jgi:hypothetical protein
MDDYWISIDQRNTENIEWFDIDDLSSYFLSCYCVVISLCTVKINYDHLNICQTSDRKRKKTGETEPFVCKIRESGSDLVKILLFTVFVFLYRNVCD